ncbi:MAG: DUF2207 domain-containing protein, partial [Epsilonproteobacteria bacterium]|nr:DUF2207 domain-containing protein [Campylobacterota bacterium]
KGLSLLESALLIDKFADSKDLAPAILELGAKGYLKIRKEDRDIIIEKIKDVDNQLTFDQKKIMNELLFKDSNSYTISPYNNRGREIYYFAKNINNELYEWAKREGYIFDNLKESRRDFLKRALLAFGVVLLIDLFVIFKLFGVEALFLSIFGAIFIGIGLVVIISSIIKKEIFGIIFGIIWLSISASIFFSEDSYLFNLKGFFLSPIFIVPLLGGFIYFIYHKVGRYTQKGIRVVRKLYGLERFIKRVEQDKIKRFLKSDPNYLDKLLPYAVMFGLNEHWFRVYEEFNKEPSFFLAPIYEVDFFNREFMNAASIGESSLSTPSSIDSISMGGSFGGGGVGGGGGGSW